MMKIVLEIPDTTQLMTFQYLYWNFEDGCYMLQQQSLDSIKIKNASAKERPKREE